MWRRLRFGRTEARSEEEEEVELEEVEYFRGGKRERDEKKVELGKEGRGGKDFSEGEKGRRWW